MYGEQSVGTVCAKCGSRHVIQGAAVEAKEDMTVGSSGRLTVRVSRPGFLGFSSSSRGDISATVCAQCGYTEFYADNLGELWQTYSQENR